MSPTVIHDASLLSLLSVNSHSDSGKPDSSHPSPIYSIPIYLITVSEFLSHIPVESNFIN